MEFAAPEAYEDFVVRLQLHWMTAKAKNSAFATGSSQSCHARPGAGRGELHARGATGDGDGRTVSGAGDGRAAGLRAQSSPSCQSNPLGFCCVASDLVDPPCPLCCPELGVSSRVEALAAMIRAVSRDCMCVAQSWLSRCGLVRRWCEFMADLEEDEEEEVAADK